MIISYLITKVHTLIEDIKKAHCHKAPTLKRAFIV